MEEPSDELNALKNYIESALEEINSAAVAANEMGYAEIAPWLEWIGEELGDLLLNVLREPSIDELRGAQEEGKSVGLI